MTAPAPTTGPAADATTTTTTTAAPAATVVPAGATVAGTQQLENLDLDKLDSVEKLPKWAQKLVGELRDKDAKGRIKLTEAEQRQKDILKAAGIETDEQDPVKIAETARAEREAAQKETRDTKVELAVFRQATGAGADPNSLLDSRAFMAKLDKADPDDPDGIKTLIADWVKDNPKFKTTAPRAGGVSGADFTGGTGGPTDIQSRIAAAEKAGDFKEAIRLKQQLNT